MAKRVMIADDSEFMRNLLREILEDDFEITDLQKIRNRGVLVREVALIETRRADPTAKKQDDYQLDTAVYTDDPLTPQ